MNNIDSQLTRIESKFLKLKRLDKGFTIFGSRTHQYLFNSPLSEQAISNFEARHKISLPVGYRKFLLVIGNGGAGPYYGLEPLEDSLYVDLDFKNTSGLINPSEPFPFTEKWNLNLGEVSDTEYFHKKWINGLLRLSNFGCGVFLNLVVNGAEYGHVWADDRCNDEGLYPVPIDQPIGRIDFLGWYELWLDKSLSELAS